MDLRPRCFPIFVTLLLLLLAPFAASAQTVSGGSIHGNVAFFPPALGNNIRATPVALPIFVPDIVVVAENLETKAVSDPVVTNPQGYFRTPDLPAGLYEVCATGNGFARTCLDQRIEVNRPVVVLRDLVPVRPAANAITGTVTLADHRTPCYFFSPAFNPIPLVARVSFLDGSGKVQAGPVSGNAAGQFVLPVAAEVGQGTLHVGCDASVQDRVVDAKARFPNITVAIAASAPRVLGFDFAKNGAGVRRADPGDGISASVTAEDPDGASLHYVWADGSGQIAGAPDSPTITWKLPDLDTLNTLTVYVSNGRGGVTTYSRPLRSGLNENRFTGQVVDRATKAGVPNATVSLNNVVSTADGSGNFSVAAPDAARFVLNVTHPGYALASQVLNNLAVGMQIPLDPVQTPTVDGGRGGTIHVGPGPGGGGCGCMCKGGDRDRFHILVEAPDTRIDIHHDDRDDGERGGKCGGGDALAVGFPPGAFADASGATHAGPVTIESFRYDLSQTNPIPGDLGGVFDGKSVRLGSFGAFHLLPRDASGAPLRMASGKHATISLPIDPAQQAAAPATIPLFHYDEATGQWIEDGQLTRSGGAYVGEITHFSVFNADTVSPGGACVKVVLSGFPSPVTLDAVYYDPSVGTFHHNGFPTSDTIVGIERMTPNQSFTLNITGPGVNLSAPLFSGPGLDPALFPGGLDTDTTNFSHCNGPVQIANNTLPPNEPTNFLTPHNGGSFSDRSAQYQAATDANPGGSRATLDGWKQANGFSTTGSPVANEAKATYFNNGDLKFGRDMHCRLKTAPAGAVACYVSNFGVVGTDDATTAVPDANTYEASNQVSPTPVATVTMEYDPTQGAAAVQFWAYGPNKNYVAHAALDSQGAKPLPDLCLGCHQGSYSGAPGAKATGAVFLAFDLDSFLNAAGQPIQNGITVAQQTQFHTLNNMVAATNAPSGVTQLVNSLWYANTNPSSPFLFGQRAANLPGQPFLVQPGNIHHEPVYDAVVAPVCRTCHVAIQGSEWNAYSQMGTFIQGFACGPAPSAMPHAEVPWKRYWQQSLSSTLASELLFQSPGCPQQ